MNANWPDPSRRELAIAIAAGAAWALLGLAVAAHGAENHTQVSCRIANHLPNGTTNIGSGTLIDVTADRQRGLILSCAHLFTEGTGRVVVEFAGGRTHGANVIAIDRNADLSALEIASPPGVAAPVSFVVDDGATLTACGFGPSGQFRAVSGRIVGAAQGTGQTSLRIGGAVRSGDSGGGVFDPSGRLVAVVWGESGGETYASSGAPLRSFLERLTGRGAVAKAAAPSTTICPNGRCPLLGPASPGAAPAGQWPAAGGTLFGGAGKEVTPSADAARECPCDCDEQLGKFTARLDALEQAKQDRGDYLLRGQLDAYVRTEQLAQVETENRQRHDSLLSRLETLGPLVAAAGRAAVPAATTALGLSGPMGWAMIVAATVGSGLLGRWMQRRSKLRVASREFRAGSPNLETRNSQPATLQEATAAAEGAFPSPGAGRAALHVETQQPIERDDREARELLRLSQLEGRDPLQDALAGRLALDRLDALAESDVDPQRARLADELRRELRERFNEIAPTKFQIKAES